MNMMKRSVARVASFLPIGCLLIAACAAPMEDETVVGNSEALSAPPASCLTVVQCSTFPCPAGNRWAPSPGPIISSNQTSSYGSSACPGYYVLDILGSSGLPVVSASLSISPTSQPSPCPGSSLNAYVYGHEAAGWTQVPGLTTLETPVSVQGACGLSGIETNLGGLPQYDTLRVLTGGAVTGGAELPLTVQINGCVPLTCAMVGSACGTVADRCGGYISCNPCPPTTPPDPPPHCRGRACF